MSKNRIVHVLICKIKVQLDSKIKDFNRFFDIGSGINSAKASISLRLK